MKKSVIIIIMVIFGMATLSSCNNEEIGYKEFFVTDEKIELYNQYNNCSMGEKQIFNYFINNNYKYYNKLTLREPVHKDKFKQIKSICEFLLDEKLDTDNKFEKIDICRDDYMSYDINYITTFALKNKVNFIIQSKKNIDKRENDYIDTLDLMYKDIKNYDKLSDNEKHFFSYMYNQMYLFMPKYTFIKDVEEDKLLEFINNFQESTKETLIYNPILGYGIKDNKVFVIGFKNLEDRQISDKSFNNIYSHFIDDYKNFYQFLGKTIDTKNENVKSEYIFEKPVYYEFAEYMVNLFFERENKFELYEYTFDDCGMVTGFKYKKLDEIIKRFVTK